MTIAQMIQQMISYSDGNVHDINHFMKVWAYAKTIGELECLDNTTQFILEAAAVIHDIACPLCREKYGNTDGRHQETEGPALAAEFLKEAGLPAAVAERIIFLVGHHHTFSDIDGLDYQILLEADFIVNAQESMYSRTVITNFIDKTAKTRTGIMLLKSVYTIKDTDKR